MTGPEHYRAAEHWLAVSKQTHSTGGLGNAAQAEWAVDVAAVHAQLAAVAIAYDSAYEMGPTEADAWRAAINADNP